MYSFFSLFNFVWKPPKFITEVVWDFKARKQILGMAHCVHCDLDLGNMTLVQVKTHLCCHWQQMCEMLTISNMAVMRYGMYTDFGYVCTVTLTLEIWPWFKVMTHPWHGLSVMDNCVKHYPDRTWQWGVLARTWILGMPALQPWPWRYDLESRSWHTLGSWTTIV